MPNLYNLLKCCTYVFCHEKCNLLLHTCIYPTPSLLAGCNPRSIFKWSLTGLNPEFSFSLTSRHTKLKSLLCPTIYPYLEGELWVWFCWVLWHINHCRLYNAKSIVIHINCSISNNSV